MTLKRKILIPFAVAVFLVLLWPVLLRFGSTGALKSYRKELVAHGEKLGISEVAPNVTADQAASAREAVGVISTFGPRLTNFPPFTRVIAPGHVVVTWKEDPLPDNETTNVWPELRELISANAQPLETVRAALKQPVGELRLDYSQGPALLLPHLAPTKKTVILLSSTAMLELHEGRPAEACEDLKASIAVTHLLDHEAIVISQLVRVADLQIALSATWQTLQYPGLQDDKLAELQKVWESVDTMSGAAGSLEMERNTEELIFTMMRHGSSPYGSPFPSGSSGGLGASSRVMDTIGQAMANPKEGYETFMDQGPRYWAWLWKWSYDEELYETQVIQAAIVSARAMRTNGALLGAFNQFVTSSTNILKSHGAISEKFQLGNNEICQNYLRKMIVMETGRRLLVTAIALKRFQIAHGKYPSDLKELTPGFLAAVPLDPMDGKPLRYHPTSDGTFLLYSIGMDGVDDGGSLAPITNTKMWYDSKDIVWPMPATAEETADYEKKTIAAWTAKQSPPKPRKYSPGK